MLFVITHWKALQCPQSGRLLAFADVLHGNDFDGLPWKGWSRQLSDERSTAAWPLQAENRTACLLTRVGHALGNRKRFLEHKCGPPLLHCHGPRHRGALFIVPQGLGRLGAALQSALHHMLFMTRSQKSQAGAPAFGTCSVSGRRRWAPDLHGWARRSRDVHRRQANESPAHQI